MTEALRERVLSFKCRESFRESFSFKLIGSNVKVEGGSLGLPLLVRAGLSEFDALLERALARPVPRAHLLASFEVLGSSTFL